jgi:hypothetical protein
MLQFCMILYDQYKVMNNTVLTDLQTLQTEKLADTVLLKLEIS